MAVDIDRLQIQIKADATSADKALGNLATKIGALSTALNGLPVSKINSLSNAVAKLGTSMQVLNSIRVTSFQGLATKINTLANIDSARLNQAANSIHHISNTLSNLGNVSQGAVQISEVAKNIAKLGGKNVTNAIANLPLLTRELNNMLTTLSRSPQVSRNIIDMTNALANLASQGRNISTVTNGMVNGLNRQSRAMNTARRSSFNLASAFGMLYAKYFLVMRAIKAFGRAITSTSDYIEAYNYYNVAFGKIAEEWKGQYEEYGYANAEAYADSFTQRMNESLSKMSGLQVSVGADGTGLLTTTGMKNLGLNIQEVTQYASQLASVTNSVGQTGEVSLIAADAFTKLGADISSLFNIDYASVMGNLQSGLIGQSRALYKYGIDITNATLQTYAYELGLSKAVSEMTQAEKMQLRMIAILDQSKVSWGDLANTINSPSNMLRQFKNNLSEVGNVLGQLFIPIMQKAMPVINGLTIALKDFLVNLASFMGIKLDLGAFGQGFADLEDETGGLSDNLDDIASSAKKATAGLRKFDELNNINISDKNGGGAGALGSSIDLTKEISAAAEEYQKVWNEAYEKMENRAQELSKSFRRLFAPIENIFKNLFKGNFELAGSDFSNLILGITTFFSNAINKVNWEKLGRDIGDFLAGIDWLKIIGNGISLAFDAGKVIAETWFGSFETAPIETAIISGLLLLNFTAIGNKIGTKLSTKIATALATKLGMAGTFTSVGTVLVTAIGASFATALASVGGLGNLLTLDMIGLVGAGGWKVAGLLIGGSIIGGIVASVGGFSFGQWLNEIITGEKIDMSWSEQFKAIKDSFSDGSWKEALSLWRADSKAGLESMSKDLESWLEEHVGKWAGFTFEEAGVALSDFGKTYITEPLKMWGKDISDWWNNDVKPWFTVTKWVELSLGAVNGIKATWNGFKDWWKNTGIYKWWVEDVRPWFTLEKWTDLLSGPIKAFEDFWKDITGWLDGISQKWNNLFGEKGAFMGGAASVVINGGARSIPTQTYATGGFPEDGLFYANHTELVGQFSNGRTAVANNQQITQGIADAVYPAVYNAVVSAMANNGGNTIKIEGDPHGMFKAFVEEWNNESRRTQKNPVPIYSR